MLNVGCGRRFHSDWVNVDLVPSDESVQVCDISKGLPFDDGHFDAVYHSHVLEHLHPKTGRELLAECWRVLKPGGVVRVVVPDLVDDSIEDKAFAKMRIGHEFGLCDTHEQPVEASSTLLTRLADGWSDCKNKMARRVVRWLLGRRAEAALEESLFRQQGEVHRWMYDRFSLRELFEASGFEGFQVQNAVESQIDRFVDFQLDSYNGEVRKPDSIFVEAIKPAVASAVRRAA